MDNLVNSFLGIMDKLEKISPLGKRILSAFKALQIKDKKIIAEILGFKSAQGLYKVLQGKRELGFESLIKFRKTTNCSIDWLLTEEGNQYVDSSEILPQQLAELVNQTDKYDNLDIFVVTLAEKNSNFRKMLNDISFKTSQKTVKINEQIMNLLYEEDREMKEKLMNTLRIQASQDLDYGKELKAKSKKKLLLKKEKPDKIHKKAE